MKIKVGVFGSCISRDLFNSNFVEDYKDFFEVTISAFRTSMISLMQNPIHIDEKLIKITPNNPQNNAKTKFINYDLKKTLLKELMQKNIDCLIIDNFLEVRMGILYLENDIITNNYWDLPLTEFYKKSEIKFKFNINDYPSDYFQIWTKYCDLFFNFLNEKCPNVKIILNKARAMDKVINNDGSIYINPEFTKMAKTTNFYLDKFDSYIQQNYDVEVIDFDFENTFLDENHLWGIGQVHYFKDYYTASINKIKKLMTSENYKNTMTVPDSHSNQDNFRNNNVKMLNSETKLHISNIVIKTMKNELLKNYKIINSLKNELESSKQIDHVIAIQADKIEKYQNDPRNKKISDQSESAMKNMVELLKIRSSVVNKVNLYK